MQRDHLAISEYSRQHRDRARRCRSLSVTSLMRIVMIFYLQRPLRWDLVVKKIMGFGTAAFDPQWGDQDKGTVGVNGEWA